MRGVNDSASGVESCATLQQPCPEGVTYNADATVESSMFVILKRKARR